jgi:hypothetical protein
MRRSHVSIALSSVLGALVAFGCSGGSSDNTLLYGGDAAGLDGSADVSNVTGPPVAESDFCRQYTLAVCDTKKNCCPKGEDGGSTFDEAQCISNTRNACDAATKGEQAKKTTYDPTAGGNCVARAAAGSCDVRTTSVSDDCPDVYVGTAQIGDLCDAAKCAPGLLCPVYPALGCQGCPGPPPSKCVAPSGVGESCAQLSTLCADGLVCNGGTCRERSLAGAACTQSDDCQTGLYCDTLKTKACQPKLGIGEHCSDLTWCVSGECLNGVCTPTVPAICR